MNPDPVVEEMRRHGAEIAEECNGDIHRMAERFREEQAKGSHPVIRRAPRAPERRDRDPGQ